MPRCYNLETRFIDNVFTVVAHYE